MMTANMGKTGRRNCNKHDAPTPGTKLRAFYDALRRGESITNPYPQALFQLRSFYGMEIGHRRGGGSFLIGEWVGPTFVPLDKIIAETYADANEQVA